MRQSLLLQRSQQPKQKQAEKSAIIVDAILQSDAFRSSENIALYHAVRGEADPAGLIYSRPDNSEKNFFLPVISSNKSQGLEFAPFNTNTQYKNNQFSIPEPSVESSDLINGESLDLVIMPLLGFDNKGNRLGMGGGYYDRCFSFKKSSPKKPVLLGFAYDFQQIDAICTEPWDIRLDMITTELRFLYF